MAVALDPGARALRRKVRELLRLLCSIARCRCAARGITRRWTTAKTVTRSPAPHATLSRTAGNARSVFDATTAPSRCWCRLDFFKKFNDTHGHEAGDRVLQHVAAVIRQTVRDVDTPARFGGEEFVVLMPETGYRASHDAAERLRRAIESHPLTWNGRPLAVTVSIGAAGCPDCTVTASEVMRLADEALYRAKAAGRNRVASAPKLGASAAGPACRNCTARGSRSRLSHCRNRD